MATLKNMTRIGADVRQIARLLQAKAPENHMLAYITPEEAQFLKARGGSGMPDPETGVLSFAPVSEYADIGPQVDYTPSESFTSFPPVAQVEAQAPAQETSFAPQNYFNAGDNFGFYGMQERGSSFAQPYSEGQGFQARPDLLYATPNLPKGLDVSPPEALVTPKGAEDLNLMERLSGKTGMSKESLARLGLAGIQAIIGAQASKRAAEQGQRGRAETQALAAPYQAKGAELQRQAQSGELTPVARQQLQAIQAQVAQSASARGGVGAQQSAARVEAIRNQLLQQQNDYGMKLTSIGDQIALGAIRTGLQADQFANQLTSSYFTNIMRTLAGTPTVIQYGAPQ
jgi:hypothetical protein